jgi:hypothetical protein
MRGMNWVFKSDRYNFVLTGLNYELTKKGPRQHQILNYQSKGELVFYTGLHFSALQTRHFQAPQKL